MMCGYDDAILSKCHIVIAGLKSYNDTTITHSTTRKIFYF